MDSANYRTPDDMIRAQESMKAERAREEMSKCCAAREMTVGEHLDQQINTVARQLNALKDLRASLPGSFLESGFSRIAPLSGAGVAHRY